MQRTTRGHRQICFRSKQLWKSIDNPSHCFILGTVQFNIPNLRVGTLDSLLALSDDLLKSNSFIEGVSHKIRRQTEELERVSGVVSSSLTVDGVPVDSYLTRFVWDEAKYPTMSALKEIVDGIHVQVAKIEDELKVAFKVLKSGCGCGRRNGGGDAVADAVAVAVAVAGCKGRSVTVAVRVAEYNNVRSQLNAINRKQSGSLAVCDLSNLVKPQDIIITEHLKTLLAIVPKYSQKDWLSSYKTLTAYVVPRSSKKLHEDNEYALYTVTLFSRDVDNFRTKARDRGFQIRDFEYNPETQESRKQELEKLLQDQETLRNSLCNGAMQLWGGFQLMDALLCCMCIYREHSEIWLATVFLSVVLAPSVKSEKKARSILEELCDSANSTYWKSEDGGMGGLGGDADAYPYVSFTINLV
ncbi:hypothetical protein ACSBR1_042965 [Camellia fascicularis]